jgi:hypothetical protein
MKQILFLFIVLISYSLQAQNKKIVFYRHLSIDDRQYQLKLKDSVDSKIADKTYCYRVVYDDKNRILQIQYLNHGNLDVSEIGYSTIQITYSDSLEQRFFSFPAKYINQQDFVVKQEKIKLNPKGIPIQVTNYDAEGKPVKDKYGIVSYVRQLNKDGWNIEENYLDENSNRIVSKNGDYYFRYNWNRDSTCYKPEITFYDKAGKLHDGDRGHSVIKSSYDRKQGNILYSKYYDAKQKLVINKNSYAYRVKDYYENGLLKSVSYFNSNEKPCCNENGYSKIVYEYNSYGNQTKRICYLKNSSHFIEYNTQYDKMQFVIEEARKRDGKISEDDLHGVAYIRYEYNPSGKLKARHTFNKNNVSVLRTEY